MSSSPEAQVSLKLVIDKKRKKILYGEADKSFIDFLFTILAFPVATVIRLLSGSEQGKGMVGSLTNLYRSIEDLNTNYFQPNQNKKNLLKPKVHHLAEVEDLLQIGFSSTSDCHYRCTNTTMHKCRTYFSTKYGTLCPGCKSLMLTGAIHVMSPEEEKEAIAYEEDGYVKEMVTYMVMDDLIVKPMTFSMSNITILRELKVKDIELIEEKVVNLDMDEGLMLLRASMYSTTVLNDVFLHKIDFSK